MVMGKNYFPPIIKIETIGIFNDPGWIDFDKTVKFLERTARVLTYIQYTKPGLNS